MARYVATVPSSRSADETFAYLAEFSNAQEWDPGVVRGARLDDGPLGVGSRFEITVRGLRESTLVYEVTAYDATARRVVLRGTNALVVSLDEITVAPDGAVTYDADLRFRGPLRVLEPMLRLSFKAIGDKAAAGLRATLA
jgi:hypothetical protein